MPYFSSFGYDCPLFSNSAEFFLNVLTPYSTAMYKAMLTNQHHTPEDMLSNMDPRFKTVVLLRAALGYHDNYYDYQNLLISLNAQNNNNGSSTSATIIDDRKVKQIQNKKSSVTALL